MHRLFRRAFGAALALYRRLPWLPYKLTRTASPRHLRPRVRSGCSVPFRPVCFCCRPRGGPRRQRSGAPRAASGFGGLRPCAGAARPGEGCVGSAEGPSRWPGGASARLPARSLALTQPRAQCLYIGNGPSLNKLDWSFLDAAKLPVVMGARSQRAACIATCNSRATQASTRFTWALSASTCASTTWCVPVMDIAARLCVLVLTSAISILQSVRRAPTGAVRAFAELALLFCAAPADNACLHSSQS